MGVTTGLAWTEVCGELLPIESVLVPGKGKMTITGKLGDVMQESVQAAKSYVRSRSRLLGVEPSRFESTDIHIHVPEGATPKDGPSAGVAMVTSIVSVLTRIPVKASVAMTGEVTLRGRVLPIGGLKEKLLAALRGGIKTVLIPKDNEKDLAEIPDNVKKGLKIIPVGNVDEVLQVALTGSPRHWPRGAIAPEIAAQAKPTVEQPAAELKEGSAGRYYLPAPHRSWGGARHVLEKSLRGRDAACVPDRLRLESPGGAQAGSSFPHPQAAGSVGPCGRVCQFFPAATMHPMPEGRQRGWSSCHSRPK